MIHLAIRMNGYMTYTSVSLKNTWRWKERKHWWNKFITEENKNERLGGKKGERHWKIKGTRTEIKHLHDNTTPHELAAYVRPQILLLLDDRFTSSTWFDFCSYAMRLLCLTSSPGIPSRKWPFSLFHFVEAMWLILV